MSEGVPLSDEERARQLLELRVPSYVELARARRDLVSAQAAAAEAERADARAWAACVKAGWSVEELRSQGLTPPVRRSPGRPAGGRRRRGETPPASSAEGPELSAV